MEKVLKMIIRYTCEDSKADFHSLYRTEYETISFDEIEITKFVDGITEYMNENFGNYWKQPTTINRIMVQLIQPGVTYDGKTFIEELETKIRWRYGATWIGGVYNSIEEFKENLNYIKNIYNVYLNSYKKYKEEN